MQTEKNVWLKVLSMILTLALLISCIPNQVYAMAGEAIANLHETVEEINKPFDMIFEDVPVTLLGEVESLRTETEKHFRLSNGKNIAVAYGMPIHYKNAAGEWVDIDNTLSLSADQAAYTTTNALSTTAFAANLATGRVLTASYDNVSISMSLMNQKMTQSMVMNSVATMQTNNVAAYDKTVTALTVSDINVFADMTMDTADNSKAWTTEDLIPEKLQSSIIYEDVYPGVDLLYTAYGYNIKEQIIVNETQAQYCYDFLLQTDGLNAVLNADNSISLTDEEGNVIYSIPAPYMADAVGNTSADVEYTLTQVAEGYVLTVEANAEWINAKERVFPVAIDPTIENMAVTKNENLYVTYVTEGSPEVYHPGYQQLYFGYGAAASAKEGRIFMHVSELPDIPDGSMVTDAQISLYLYNYTHVNCSEIGAAIYEVTDDKPDGRTYKWWIQYMDWNDQPAYDTDNMIDYVMLKDGQGGFQDWNITELVKKWYVEGTENCTMAMAITPGTRAYSSSYCAVPVFLAYGTSSHPIVTVTYQNNVGVEDYYTYATLGGGDAGTAYIADATGRLTVMKELVSYASTINPFTMSLVYNTNASAKNVSAEDSQAENVLTMRLGTNWSLDVIQMMEPDDIGGTQYMKYTDGDGTVHYFVDDPEDEETVFYDEDGLGLQVVVGSDGTYVMSDMQDNSYTFTNKLLTNIRDNNNNQYFINYANGKLTSIVQKNNGCSEITVATFAYQGDYLSAVTDAAGVVHSIDYDNDQICSIYTGNTEVARYSYSGDYLIYMAEVDSGYGLEFTYTNDGKVNHYGEWTLNGQFGAQIDVYYDGWDKTTYHDYGNDRNEYTEDDLFTYYLFDYAGRTVNAYSTDAVGNVIGATNAVYTSTSGIDKRNNRVLKTASVGVAAEQELLNSGFEDNAGLYQWNLSGNITPSQEKPHTGAYSLKGVLTSGQQSVTARMTNLTLYADGWYTLTAYVHTSGMSFDEETGIALTVDNGVDSLYGDYLYWQTLEAVDDGWNRMTLTFSVGETGTYAVGIAAVGGVGTFYVDDFQLEKGEGPSNRNMLENGNFQAGGYGWTFGSNGEYRSNHGMHRDHGTAIAPVITSSPLNGNANISQTVTVNLPGTETYVLSGWASANAVPDTVDTTEDWAQDTTKTFGLRAILTYDDGTTEYHYVPFNADLTDWQYTSLTIIPGEPTKTVATITVVCAYEKNGNSASFDNISLVQHLAYSMTYNDDGEMTEIHSAGVTTDLYEDAPNTENDENTLYDEVFKHRLLWYRDELTNTTMTYDGVGNMTSSIVASNTNGSLTMRNESIYGNMGNLLLESTDTNGITTSYGYSSDLNKMLALPSAVTDANGTVTNILYDNFGRTTRTSVANRAILEYTYDDGNLTEILRSASSGDQTYSFEYDVFGNMTKLKVGTQTLATYQYGANNGLLLKQTYGNGVYVTFTYDNLGRVKMARYSDGGIVLYYYTGDGQLSCVAENKATYYYFYDVTGQLIASEKRDNSGKMLLRVDLQYNDAGQLVGQTWNIEGTVYSESYTYAEDGTLSSMTTATGQTLQMTYDDLQRLTSVASNLYTKNYTYKNLSDRTTNLVSQLQYTDLPTTLAFGYTYDALGNIATYTAPDGEVITYTYDNLGQLLSAVGDQTYTYTYDSVGNLLTANGHTYTYGNADWRDLLTAFDGQSITYDASGNPLSYYNGTRWSFTWKNGRKLVSASSANGTITFEYDFDGLRTSKKVGNVTHNYLYANGQLLRETYGSNVLDFYYDVEGYPYALKYNGTTYYYITNLQGDVMYLLDGTGATVASYEYDPYGNIISAIGPMAEINPLRYRGYYYDAELEMYYLQSRYYDPMVGRFINADDVAFLSGSGTALGFNMYAYCENNPVNMLDESGYIGIPWQIKVGLVAGIGGALWDMAKYIMSHRGQKVASWAYIKGLGGALINGFVRGFIVGIISTIPKTWQFGLLGGTVYLVHGLLTGSIKTLNQGMAAFLNGWTNGVISKSITLLIARIGGIIGTSAETMAKLEYITGAIFALGLERYFTW